MDKDFDKDSLGRWYFRSVLLNWIFRLILLLVVGGVFLLGLYFTVFR